MIIKLQAIEKFINSELSSKIKKSTIDNEELLIEIYGAPGRDSQGIKSPSLSKSPISP